MNLVEFKVELPAASAEAVNETLLELGFERWSVYEDVIAQRAWLVGVFEERASAETEFADLKRALQLTVVAQPEVRDLADADWRESYKLHFRAWKFGKLHWVPVWERASFIVPPGERVLWLDPGMAFGTGNHETTRLCVERLVAFAEEQGTAGKVVDAGCGSGILALSAARLGFQCVRGFDNDPEAVEISRENAGLNDLLAAVDFSVADVATGVAGPSADLIMANILAPVLIANRKDLLGAVRPNGWLVLSGILSSEIEEVRAAFLAEAKEWACNSRSLGEWSDLVLSRPG